MATRRSASLPLWSTRRRRGGPRRRCPWRRELRPLRERILGGNEMSSSKLTRTGHVASHSEAATSQDASEVRSLVVVGLGYIGLPTATMFARSGLKVTGVDVNPTAVAAVN